MEKGAEFKMRGPGAEGKFSGEVTENLRRNYERFKKHAKIGQQVRIFGRVGIDNGTVVTIVHINNGDSYDKIDPDKGLQGVTEPTIDVKTEDGKKFEKLSMSEWQPIEKDMAETE